MLPKATKAGLETYKTYAFTYHFDGERWELLIKAKDQLEACRRLEALQYAEFTGEVAMSVKAHVPSWWWSIVSRWS